MALLLRGLCAFRSLAPGKLVLKRPSASHSRGITAGSRKAALLVRQWTKTELTLTRRHFSSKSSTPKSKRTRAEEDSMLWKAMDRLKSNLPDHGSQLSEEKRNMLETLSTEELVKNLTEPARERILGFLEDETRPADVKDILESMDTFSFLAASDLVQKKLHTDSASNEQMLDFLASPLPDAGTDLESSEAELYRRNLDIRVSHISALTIAAEASEETRIAFAESSFIPAVLEMIPLSLDKPAVMCAMIRALRSMVSQETAVRHMHEKVGFVRTLVGLLKSSDVSLRIEASALIALLTVLRDMVTELKNNNAVSLLTAILSSPMGSDEIPVYNNGIVALVRIVGASGESIVEDLKKAQVVTPLCNIINKLDRSPDVHDAVVTLLSTLAGSPEIALQIVSAGCVPSLSRLLGVYTQMVSGNTPQREFRRITRAKHETKTAQSQEQVEGIVEDDDDIAEDHMNPIFRGSSLEDIVSLMRLLSRVPDARRQMKDNRVLTLLSRLIELPTLTFSQKTQATNCLHFFASDSSYSDAVVQTGVAKTLVDQLYQPGTSVEEISFQAHALCVVAHLSVYEEVQKHVAHKHWLNSVVSRAPKAPSPQIKIFTGTILLNLLKGDRSEEIREIINNSPAIAATIAHMVQEETKSTSHNKPWSIIYSKS